MSVFVKYIQLFYMLSSMMPRLKPLLSAYTQATLLKCGTVDLIHSKSAFPSTTSPPLSVSCPLFPLLLVLFLPSCAWLFFGRLASFATAHSVALPQLQSDLGHLTHMVEEAIASVTGRHIHACSADTIRLSHVPFIGAEGVHSNQFRLLASAWYSWEVTAASISLAC